MRFLLGMLLICSLLFSQNFDDEFGDEFEEEKQSVDTFKSYNIIMTQLNDKVYTYVFNPIASGYEYTIHKDIRIAVSNVYSNLKFPINFVNNLLQLKFENSFAELQRFLINSTLGIAGTMDIAKDDFHIEAKKEDFGQTLGYYGFNNTPHIVLPFLGSSNVRDILGLGGDYFINPLSYINNRGNLLANETESTYTKAYDTLNTHSFNYKIYEKAKKDSVDLYSLLKNVYEQRRNKEISE